MKQALIIGSTVLDVIIHVTSLPSSQEDLHVEKQTLSLGGCAFNVHHTVDLFKIPTLLCSPVGTGFYGDYVAKELEKRGITPFVRTVDMDNGCCYCYVDPQGERSFLSYHGAEYKFYESFLDSVDISLFDCIYVCGLEIEEDTGSNLVTFLEKNSGLDIYYAPGPRIMSIAEERMNALLALSPILHMNRNELLAYTGSSSIEEGTALLYQKSRNLIVVTDGDKGSYAYDGVELVYSPAVSAETVDTIGAGDSHVGAFIAARKLGHTTGQSLQIANQISAKVVASRGALLPEEDFHWEPGEG
ncbi:MAG: PfkB family carbohydrate kinase [Spirochaetales bacterium]|nr:PfkB family carbohydrate kinase [Spirochaetales bacterium]